VSSFYPLLSLYQTFIFLRFSYFRFANLNTLIQPIFSNL